MALSRRRFGQVAAGAALSACAPQAGPGMGAVQSRQFPEDFIWGVASAAFQTEGALNVDGRGLSIWDVFPASRIADRSNAAIATDSYRRMGEDVALVADLGAKAYRFSISWTRIFPEGAGAMNEAGVDHYARLVDQLLARGVTPYATLFHWDLPFALFEAGGWAARDTASRFAEYAALIGARLGDRLKHIVVLNEAAVHTIVGHVLGVHAPGFSDPALLGPVMHHLNLAQGLAIQALRAGQSDLTIGTTMALQPSRAAGGLMSPLNTLADSTRSGIAVFSIRCLRALIRKRLSIWSRLLYKQAISRSPASRSIFSASIITPRLICASTHTAMRTSKPPSLRAAPSSMRSAVTSIPRASTKP